MFFCAALLGGFGGQSWPQQRWRWSALTCKQWSECVRRGMWCEPVPADTSMSHLLAKNPIWLQADAPLKNLCREFSKWLNPSCFRKWQDHRISYSRKQDSCRGNNWGSNAPTQSTPQTGALHNEPRSLSDQDARQRIVTPLIRNSCRRYNSQYSVPSAKI